MDRETTSLLYALIRLMGRLAFDEDSLRELIGTKSKKLFDAYNLCDGTKTQQEIAKVAKLDSGNFSRTVQRWIDFGFVFKINNNEKITLLNVYPLPKSKK